MSQTEQLLEYIPAKWQAKAKEIATALKKADNFLVLAHVGLDGDACGSLFACAYILQTLNKKYYLYSKTGQPDYLNFLQSPVPIQTSLEHLPFRPETLLVLDCNAKERLETDLVPYLNLPLINIDHHRGGNFTGIIWDDTVAAATVQLVAYTALALDIELKDELANAIATGIITDTGSFRHSNVSAEILRLVALLVENGCPLSKLQSNINNSWSLNKMRLWAHCLANTRFYHGQIVFCSILLQDLANFQANKDDLEGLPEYLRCLKGSKIVIVLREINNDSFRINLRSEDEIDVCLLANQFGGGGHKNAAGAFIDLPLAEAEKVLIKAALDLINR